MEGKVGLRMTLESLWTAKFLMCYIISFDHDKFTKFMSNTLLATDFFTEKILATQALFERRIVKKSNSFFRIAD